MKEKIAASVLAVALMSGTALADVVTREVRFESHGEPMVGTLYLPDEAGGSYPGVIVTGAWMTVKEQMPAVYARAMAERGFAALAFDFRGWGESGGERRQKEDPTAKIQDIEAAAAFMLTLPEVSGTAVGGLGICASSGYMVHAAAEQDEIGSVALVAPWLHDKTLVEAVYGGTDGVARLIEIGQAAEETYKQTGRPVMVTAASRTDESSIMYGADYYTEIDRGQIPAWRNEADLSFWEGWLTFDAQAIAPTFDKPFLMVESEAAVLPQGARQFFQSLRGNKDEVWLDGVSQFDFYDRPAPVNTASDAVAEHFRKSL